MVKVNLIFREAYVNFVRLQSLNPLSKPELPETASDLAEFYHYSQNG